MTEPLVRAIVVNHDGGRGVLECLAALAASEWPRDRLELVVVDNASRDGSADEIAHAFPQVRLLRLWRNLGFAGGNNAALRDLGSADYVALVNNDAFVEPGWLRPLVERLAADEALGAACPKILLAGSFAEIELRSPTHVRGRTDPRPLGVKVLGVHVAGGDEAGVGSCNRTSPKSQGQMCENEFAVEGLTRGNCSIARSDPGGGSDPGCGRTYFAGGFHGPELEGGRPFQWSSGRGRLLVQVGPDSSVELLLGCERSKDAVARSGGAERTLAVGPLPAWLRVPAQPLGVPVVNSVGALVSPGGYGSDRGFLEPDRGQHDEPVEVDAWSGAAVLLRRRYLEQTGLFDERLFLYYEDSDLAWRGRRLGWRYATEPASLVRHAHASSAGAGSALFDYLNERNRLLVFTKNAPGALARAAVADSLYTTALHVKRDLLARVLAGERPDPTFVGRRLRATAGYALSLPRVLAERRRLHL